MNKLERMQEQVEERTSARESMKRTMESHGVQAAVEGQADAVREEKAFNSGTKVIRQNLQFFERQEEVTSKDMAQLREEVLNQVFTLTHDVEDKLKSHPEKKGFARAQRALLRIADML